MDPGGGGVLKVLPLSLWRLDNNQTQLDLLFALQIFHFLCIWGGRRGLYHRLTNNPSFINVGFHLSCKHIRSAVIGLAHALCRDTWQARRCVVIVLVLRNSGCTTVYNKSKLTVTEAHTITLDGVRSGMPK